MIKYFCNKCGAEMEDGPIEDSVFTIAETELNFKILPCDCNGNPHDRDEITICLSCVLKEIYDCAQNEAIKRDDQ